MAPRDWRFLISVSPLSGTQICSWGFEGAKPLKHIGAFTANQLAESLRAEDVDRGLHARTEVHIAGADVQPVVRALVNVETAADLHRPAVAEDDMAIMERLFHFHRQFDIMRL